MRARERMKGGMRPSNKSRETRSDTRAFVPSLVRQGVAWWMIIKCRNVNRAHHLHGRKQPTGPDTLSTNLLLARLRFVPSETTKLGPSSLEFRRPASLYPPRPFSSFRNRDHRRSKRYCRFINPFLSIFFEINVSSENSKEYLINIFSRFLFTLRAANSCWSCEDLIGE